MTDEHVRRICRALTEVSNAIMYVAFAVMLSAMLQMCGVLGHR